MQIKLYCCHCSSGDRSEDDEVGSLCGPQYTFADEETKSHFTNYSLSSSVMRRNEQLTLLDDRFEQVIICVFLVAGHVRLVSCDVLFLYV